MKRHMTALAALAVALPVLAAGKSTQAQSVFARPTAAPTATAHTALQTPPTASVRRDSQVKPACDCVGGGYSAGPGGCDEGYCGEGCCEGECGCGDGCCNSCDSCGWPGWCNLCAGPGQPAPWYVTAEYLYVRANVSSAPAFLDQDSDNAIDTFHELDFQYQSSYRFGAGYKLPCCGEEVRFLFTRMTSSADDSATGANIHGPFETSPGPDGTFTAHGQIDAKSYDVEFAKTIPLGGCCQSGCGDGCNSCCRPSCPAWDITWEGGFRFAQVDLDRTYASDNPEIALTRTANSNISFDGGGPRFGVEGRRYFGQRQWCSAYLKGDISLLLGHVNVRDRRVSTTDDNPTTTELQTADFRNIIPVTEIETGLTTQLTSRVTFTTGYLFSAWHDLGFRDEFDFSTTPTFLETTFDTANVLGFDGFFAKFEFDF
jgi:hypothetical protein